MKTKKIGDIIADLRKERNIRQDELAEYVGVTAQAVSKWENGGMPDCELLPKIADFFGVSVDMLFGREISDYKDVHTAVGEMLMTEEEKERFAVMFDLCWTMEKALFGGKYKGKELEDIGTCGKPRCYSTVQTDEGYTMMGLSKDLPYFLLVPECKDKETALFKGIDYVSLFADLSQKDVFEALIFLYKRKSNKLFTPELLVKALSVTPTRAAEILDILIKYKQISTQKMEINNTEETLYRLLPSPSFYSLLIFAREFIDKPTNFNHYMGNRTAPYLA